jgi:hypothetical protein
MITFIDVALVPGEGISVTPVVFPPAHTDKGELFVCSGVQVMVVDALVDAQVGLFTSLSAALSLKHTDACYFRSSFAFATLDEYEASYIFSFAEAYIDERYAYFSTVSSGIAQFTARLWGHYIPPNETISTLLSFNDAQFKV